MGCDMTTAEEIPKRLWAVIRPDDDEVIGLRVCHTAEQACAAVAVQLGWNCNAFFASWLPGSRKAEEEGRAAELVATDVTGFVSADASFEDVAQVIEEKGDGIELGRFIARTFD